MLLPNHDTLSTPRTRTLRRLLLAILVGTTPVVVQADDAPLEVRGLTFKHGIAFFGELKYPADFTHFDYLNPDAPKGGTMVLPFSTAFDTLAPMSESGNGPPSGYHFRNDTLIVRSGDELSAFYGRLADGIAISEDQRTVYFRIHPEARWDDGVPITAHDVNFTFELIADEIGMGFFLRFIDDVSVISDHYVAFRLNVELTHDHITLIQYIGIMPRHIWSVQDPKAHTLEPPVSSGPYRIGQMKTGQYIEYVRNEDYWGADLPLNRGRYNFDRVRYDIYRDATVTREAFRKGLIDILDEGDVRHWVTGLPQDALDKGWLRKIRRSYGISVGIESAFILNARVPRFSDPRVRKALALSVNFDWYNEKLYYGQAIRATSYWPNTIIEAHGLPSEMELALLEPFRESLPAEVFTQPFALPLSRSPDSFRENLVEAKALLAEAGWYYTEGKLRNDDGEPFTLEFLSLDAANNRTVLPWFDTLERLGIDATLRFIESSQFGYRSRHHDYEALAQGYGMLMPPTLELRSNFHSSGIDTEGSRNWAGVDLPVVDYLIEQAEDASTLEEMVAACQALDRVLMWHYFIVPLQAVEKRRTVFWDKFGIPPEPLYRPAYPDGWWFDEVKAARIGVRAESGTINE